MHLPITSPQKKILTELELDKTIGFIFSYVPVSIIFFTLPYPLIFKFFVLFSSYTMTVYICLHTLIARF